MIERTRHASGLEIIEWAPSVHADESPLILLHEGLGSAGLWRGFPAELAARTGRRVIAWSRRGHGRSDPLERAHGPRYMHEEAAGLGSVLGDVLGVDRAVLVGHSDGASIALLYTASRPQTRVDALALLAPHVIVEDRTLAGIAAARDRYLHGDLPAHMARHHDDADALFWAWNDVWLSPDFRGWDITSALPHITCPVLVVQCEDDAYGTLRQVDLIAGGVKGPFDRLILPEGGHAPQRSHPTRVLDALETLLLSRS